MNQGEIVYLEDLVPENHLLRKIDAAVDFTKIYDIVGKLYSANTGSPSTDPVVLFKSAIIQQVRVMFMTALLLTDCTNGF